LQLSTGYCSVFDHSLADRHDGFEDESVPENDGFDSSS
jgi:hypothetical protein